MSKGNMLLGYAKGKVGGLVYTRLGGEQITKAYNGSPRNPKTHSQILQRAFFLSACKFYQRGVKNLFKFAYEDKKQNESDFNAFMRHNIFNGVPYSKDNGTNPNFPAVGKWLMSKGSLPQIRLNNLSKYYIINIDVTPNASGSTFGDFCQDLIDEYGFEKGDYLTLVRIESKLSSYGAYPFITSTFETEPIWDIQQYIIDPDDEIEIDDKTNDAIGKNADGWNIIGMQTRPRLFGACLIVSRRTKRGLKVSPSRIELSLDTEGRWSYGRSYRYERDVIMSYNPDEESILFPPEMSKVSITNIRGVASSEEGLTSINPVISGLTLNGKFPGSGNCYLDFTYTSPNRFESDGLRIVSDGNNPTVEYTPGDWSLKIIPQGSSYPNVAKLYYKDLLLCSIFKN